MSKCYLSSIDHIYDEINRISFIVESKIDLMRRTDANPDFKGLVITEQEMDNLVRRSADNRWCDRDHLTQDDKLASIVATIEANIERSRLESLRRGIVLRLDRVIELFNLNRIDTNILLIALALEFDTRFERFYAYLQDDVTKKRPSIDLCLSLLCADVADKTKTRKRFLRSSPLVKHHLLCLVEDPSQFLPPSIKTNIKIDDDIAKYLLELDDDGLSSLPCVKRIKPCGRLEDVLLPEVFKTKIHELAKVHFARSKPLTLHFQGDHGLGKKKVAEALCNEFGLGLLVVDTTVLVKADFSDFVTSVRSICRTAKLTSSLVYWDRVDALLVEEKRDRTEQWVEILSDYGSVEFIAGQKEQAFQAAAQLLAHIRVPFPRPTVEERGQLWRFFLDNSNVSVNSDVDLEAIAAEFRLTGGQIRSAVNTAIQVAYWRDPQNHLLSSEDIYASCRSQSSPNLAALAKKIIPHYTRDDIVLPQEQMAQLEEILNTVRYRALVLEQWGFNRKLSLGKGVNILFTGPPGTGKTMAADVMANELGLDLYKIDLSNVVSKYIGETEKNLSHIFDEAQSTNAILFFDEADALFGKRTAVRDAHDRYANIEVGYLLQQMEEYDGVTILATNLRRNMDDAFVRRIAFVVRFPVPNVEDRLRIWERIWPPETPLMDNLDLPFMAQQFELQGGSIKNIALAAAFLAASDGQVVGMNQLIWATRSELKKKGKAVSNQSFGPYAEHLHPVGVNFK